MNLVNRPNRKEWAAYVLRPEIKKQELSKLVNEVLNEVQHDGDEALFSYTEKFDKVILDSFEVAKEEIDKAIALVSDELKDAISLAKRNIEKFHTSQIRIENDVETTEGVWCWRKNVAIEKVGLYIGWKVRNSTLLNLFKITNGKVFDM